MGRVFFLFDLLDVVKLLLRVVEDAKQVIADDVQLF
jgi:hypothetical protein